MDPATHPSGAAPRRQRVLVVETESLLRTALARFLSRTFEIATAATAEEASTLIGAEPSFDVVLWDAPPDRARIHPNVVWPEAPFDGERLRTAILAKAR